jgi:transcriptional regulator with XRE-family HTH domain
MFGCRLKELREDHGMTQNDLADRLNTSRTTITEYERNKNEPNFDMLVKIADIFNVTTDYLLCRTNEKYYLKLLNNVNDNEEFMSRLIHILY